jgi:hypothetical protein
VGQLIEEHSRAGRLQEFLPSEVDIVHRVVEVYRDEQQWKTQRQHQLSGASKSGNDAGSPGDDKSTNLATIPIALPPRRRSA